MDSLQARMGGTAQDEPAEAQYESRRYVSPHPVVEKKKDKKPRFPKWLMPVVIAVIALGLLIGAVRLIWGSSSDGIDHSKYQAVFLASDNSGNSVYFGKLDRMSDGYYKLTNIYYLLQKSSDTSDRELAKLAVAYGSDDSMVLPREQVLFYQNMADDSKIVQAIKQDNQKN